MPRGKRANVSRKRKCIHTLAHILQKYTKDAHELMVSMVDLLQSNAGIVVVKLELEDERKSKGGRDRVGASQCET